MEVSSVKRIRSTIDIMIAKYSGPPAVAVVGYTQTYAYWVHEYPATHRQGKQDNFLLGPARALTNSGELSRVVNAAFKLTGDAGKAVLTGANRIQRESMKVVPILTGALKISCYSCMEADAPAVAAEAFARSEAVRLAAKSEAKNAARSRKAAR